MFNERYIYNKDDLFSPECFQRLSCLLSHEEIICFGIDGALAMVVPDNGFLVDSWLDYMYSTIDEYISDTISGLSMEQHQLTVDYFTSRMVEYTEWVLRYGAIRTIRDDSYVDRVFIDDTDVYVYIISGEKDER